MAGSGVSLTRASTALAKTLLLSNALKSNVAGADGSSAIVANDSVGGALWTSVSGFISALMSGQVTNSLPTRAQMIANKVPATITTIRTSGFTTAGDSGGATYIRATGPFADGSSFQSADGAWWKRAGKDVTVSLFGARGNGVYATCTIGAGALTTVTGIGVTFTAADVGKAILIQNAGVSGAPLSTTITGYTNSTTVTIAAPAVGTVTAVVFAYGTDDTAACVAAINSGATRIRFPYGIYMLAGLGEVPAGVTLEGDGWSHNNGSIPTGTILQLTANKAMYTVTGVSITAGGPQKSGIHVKGMVIDGGNFASDLAVYSACSYCPIDNVFFLNSFGRLLKLEEYFDSALTNCHFEWGGSADGTVPATHLQSGPGTPDTFEFTNNVRFVSCRWESTRGTAIFLDGGASYNTNKIDFFGCKIESEMSNVPLLLADGAVLLYFGRIVIAGQGTAGNTLAALATFTNCRQIEGFLNLEVVLGGATLTTYASFTTCLDVYPHIAITGGPNPASGALLSSDGVNASTYGIRLTEAVPTGTLFNQTASFPGGILLTGVAVPPYVTFARSDIPGEYWNFGEVIPDGGGSGSGARIMHLGNTVVFWRNDNVTQFTAGAIQLGIGATYIQSSLNGLAPSPSFQGTFTLNQTPSPGGPLGWMGTVPGTPGISTPIYGEQVYASSQASAFAPDYLSQGSIIDLTLTGNVAIANPVTATDGRRIRLVLVQDANGGHTPTFGTEYVGANIGSMASGTANQIGVLDLACVVTGARTVWMQTGWSGWK